MKESPARKVFRAFLVTTACLMALVYGAGKYIDWSKSRHPDRVFILNRIATHSVTIQYGDYAPETFCVSIFNAIDKQGNFVTYCDVKSYMYKYNGFGIIIITTNGLLDNIYGSMFGAKESFAEYYFYDDRDNNTPLLYGIVTIQEGESKINVQVNGRQLSLSIGRKTKCDSSVYVESGHEHYYAPLQHGKKASENYARQLSAIGNGYSGNYKVYYNVEMSIIRNCVSMIDSIRVLDAYKAGGQSVIPDNQLVTLVSKFHSGIRFYGGASGEQNADGIEHWEMRLDNSTWVTERTNTDYEKYYYVHESSEIFDSTDVITHAFWNRFPELSGHSLQIGENVFQNAFTSDASMFVTAAGDVAVVNVKRRYLPK